MTGILLIHGFAGGTHEVEPLRGLFDPTNYQVSVCRLAGHMGSRRELAKAGHSAWLDSVYSEFQKLKRTCNRVICIGFSMGGLLAAQLCRKESAAGIVLINTPVYYWNFPQMLRNLKTDFQFYSRHYFKHCFDKPLRSLLSFLRLLYQTKRVFSEVTCPALIFQTLDDDTVRPKSASALSCLLGGPNQICFLSSGGHEVLQTESIREIATPLVHFCEKEGRCFEDMPKNSSEKSIKFV